MDGAVSGAEAPAPFVAADVDLRDYPYMALDVVRLRDSTLAITASAEGFRAAVLLWCAAWHQVPAGSLPDDDRTLAHLAGFGRDVKSWMQVREEALHGFVACSDGRLYHPVVAEKAVEAWESKSAQRRRTAKASAARRNRSLDGGGDRDVDRDGDRSDYRNDPCDGDRDGDRDVDRNGDRDGDHDGDRDVGRDGDRNGDRDVDRNDHHRRGEERKGEERKGEERAPPQTPPHRGGARAGPDGSDPPGPPAKATKKSGPLAHLRRGLTEALVEASPDPEGFNHGREGPAITRLLARAAKEPSPEEWLRAFLVTADHLVGRQEGVWKGQPFLLSVICSGGMMPRVVDEMKRRKGREPPAWMRAMIREHAG